MTDQEYIEEAERLRRERRLAKLAEMEAADAIELLELRRKIEKRREKPAKPVLIPTKPNDQKQAFLHENSHSLERESIIFLSQDERSSQEVADYLVGITPNAVNKQLKRGNFKPGKSDLPGRGRMIDTLSVVRWQLDNGKIQEE